MTSVIPALRRDPIVWAAAVVLVALAALYAATALTPGAPGPFTRTASQLPLILLTIAGCLLTSRGRPVHERVFWVLIAVAFSCWFIGGAIYTFSDQLTVRPRLPLFAQSMFLCFYACVFVALGLAPDRRDRDSGEAIARGFRLAAVVLVVLQFVVYFGLIPYHFERRSFMTWLPMYALYVSLSSVFALLAIHRCVATESRMWRVVYGSIGLAAATWVVVDSLDWLDQIGAITLPARTPLDALWFLPHVAMICAPRFRAQHDEPTPGAIRQVVSAPGFPMSLLVAGLAGPIVHSVALTFFRPTNLDVLGSQVLTILFALVGLFALAFVQHRAARQQNARLRHDVQELSLNERRLHEQRLESLGLLAGGVAHDFNNLLMGLRGHAELLGNTLPTGHPGREHVEQIDATVDHAAALTSQMLAYAGRRPLKRRVVDVNQVVRETEALLTTVAADRADVAYSFSEAPIAVEADEAQLRQVVVNLVRNAVEALHGGPGLVRVETRRVEIDSQSRLDGPADVPRPGPYAVIEVVDTGDGMEPETVRRAFDPFFSTKQGGHGLGLAAVMGIARAHEGTVGVESVPARGSRFSLYLPWSDRPIERSEDAPPVALRTGRGTVLVVDDRDDVRRVVAGMVEQLGFDVLCAVDGAHGLALAEQTRGALCAVVLDLTMPGIGGDEVARRLHRADPNVPIVMMSGYEETELDDRTQALVAGFLNKPFTGADVRSVMQRVLLERPPRPRRRPRSGPDSQA